MRKGRRRRRDSLKAAYGNLYVAVSDLLRGADPIHLIGMGAPDDEYDPEVGTILPRLAGAASAPDVQRIVHEEFVRWFGADIAGPSADYAGVAEKIWEVWLASKRRDKPALPPERGR